jgi:tRNA pseudouridine38/39 synthase
MSGSKHPSNTILRRIRKRLGSWLSDENTKGQNVHASLFELLFPGEEFTAEKAGLLAERLRSEAERLGTRSDVGVAADSAGGIPSGNNAHTSATGTATTAQMKQKKKPIEPLDFSKYQKRNVALDIAYRGFDYHGFARSDHMDKTIEEELFTAMRKTRLVPEGVGWRELGYSRGGRTDKGVSAAGQVVALELRSKGLVGSEPVEEQDEYDYCQIINSVMSDNVRVLGWKTIDREFSARFNAQSRMYKFYFVRKRGELDIEAMQEAAGHLVGTHDFRNMCKADIPTVTNFVRKILTAVVVRVPQMEVRGYEVFELNIVGTAFLWHQIRCIAAVLAMVGEGLESQGVVRELLDVEKVTCKPQFRMAEPEPLLLYECSYDALEGRWIRPEGVLRAFDREVDREVRELVTKAQVLLTTRDRVIKTREDTTMLGGEPCKATGNVRLREPQHVPLLERKREPSIEERLARHGLTILSRGPRQT